MNKLLNGILPNPNTSLQNLIQLLDCAVAIYIEENSQFGDDYGMGLGVEF
jgi:hypothetical protein